MDKKFLFYLLDMDSENIKAEGNGIAMVYATKGGMEKRLFAIPDVPTQHAIVAEIKAEQALVNANKQLIERFEAKIKAAIDRVWGGGETVRTMSNVRGAGPSTFWQSMYSVRQFLRS